MFLTAASNGPMVHPLPMIYDSGELRRDDIGRGIPKTSKKNLSQYHIVHHKSHMD
jgi:hypothetical protein